MAAPSRSTLVLLTILASALPVAGARTATPADLVVGFAHLPAEVRAGHYGPDAVARVDEALGFAVVHAADAQATEARARADPNVRYVQRDGVAHAEAIPNDPLYAQQYAWTHLNATGAWNVTNGSASVIVALVDTGVERTHADLAGARMLPGWDFVNNDADPNDDCGHGTGVAGVVGASMNNALGIAGAAQVSIMPLKAMGMANGVCNGPFSAVASSIRYAADHGARVIAMSLGCAGCYDQATNDAIEYAWSKGVVLVGSAGNDGPCSNCVSWPAAQPHVIAVGCTDSSNAQCYFSSAGPEVEIAAPGKSIETTYRNNTYGIMSGTSISVPHVAGALALAISANPSITNADLRAKLDATAKDLGSAGRDAAYGYGIMDMGALVAAVKAAPPAANMAPTASFASTASGLSMSVDASASRDADGSIAGYAWAWGDGQTTPATASATASHAYAAAGTYTIALTVTDNQGAMGTASASVTVVAPNQPPVASFSWSAANLSASADGSASSDPDGSIASWSWAWGDGATGSGRTAGHAYASAGTYSVTLTVTDNQGATASRTASVTVSAPAAPPAPASALHVGALDGSVKKMPNADRLTWTVSVVAASGAAVANAKLTVTIASASGNQTLLASTGSNGVASFRVDAPTTPGATYTLTVSDVLLSGWTYDRASNVATSKALTTP